MSDLPAIAVIADIHFHDLDADFGFAGITIDGRRMAVRSWAETRQSTRVFNESASALHAALEKVIDQGIRHVVLLGDYSDDGQRSTLRRLRQILTRYASEHGLRFYALPGNHDIYGPAGRHQTKQFIGSDGAGVTISSDERLAQSGAITSEDMYCEGYPVGLQPMREFGYYRQPAYIHWETPFGVSDLDADRTYDVVSPDGRNRYRLMDASYLVEPEPGLWLLMLDANIFEPRNGEYVLGEEAAFIDSTAAGWNALLRCKPFLIDWIAGVSSRAKASGKKLLTFSHYPALDPFDGTSEAEATLFGETNVVRRTPQRAVAEALSRAGIDLHFSGHLHVEGVTHRKIGAQDIRNIAVPSLVAFPPAFKTVNFSGAGIEIDTISLNELVLDTDIFAAYVRECQSAEAESAEAFSATSYGDFLLEHLRELIKHRYFEKEWPRSVVDELARLTLGEICCLLSQEDDGQDLIAQLAEGSGLPLEIMRSSPFIDMVVDWYCLRQASQLAFAVIPLARRKLYASMAEHCREKKRTNIAGDTRAFLRVFLAAFAPFIERAARYDNRIQIGMTSAKEAAA